MRKTSESHSHYWRVYLSDFPPTRGHAGLERRFPNHPTNARTVLDIALIRTSLGRLYSLRRLGRQTQCPAAVRRVRTVKLPDHQTTDTRAHTAECHEPLRCPLPPIPGNMKRMIRYRRAIRHDSHLTRRRSVAFTLPRPQPPPRRQSVSAVRPS